MTTPIVSNHDQPILQLSPKGDVSTLRDADQGDIFVSGGTGSGKPSSCKAIFGALLHSGAAGLVVVAKPTDICLWQSYAKKHGRKQAARKPTAR